ncbi:hypothetical protein MBANPS3_012644, partial [Mucor bainieri]
MSAPPNQKPNGEHESLTSSAAQPPHVDHFSSKVARPYLTGTVAHSILIDITAVFDRQKEFIVALNLYCTTNTHLWAVSEQMRRDNNRIYAEISVSPTKYKQMIANPALELENFDKPLMAYPTLSPSANIVKLSLSRLPPQYGRLDGGHEQLNLDMHHNLDQFGELIDCGYVTGGSGIYAGGGYAVLAVDKKKHAPLQHSLNWSFQPMDFLAEKLHEDRDASLALATWAAMPPYCKYCHSMDHSLLNCATRKSKMTCDLCGDPGHMKRACPRQNDDPASPKKRKVSKEGQKQQSKTLTSDSRPSKDSSRTNAQ